MREVPGSSPGNRLFFCFLEVLGMFCKVEVMGLWFWEGWEAVGGEAILREAGVGGMETVGEGGKNWARRG